MDDLAVEPALSAEAAARSAATFKLLSDETRLRIVWALLHGEHAVNDLAAHLQAQAPNVSQHLAKLRLAGLVETRREGNQVFYRVGNTHVRRVVEQVVGHVRHLIEDLPDHD